MRILLFSDVHLDVVTAGVVRFNEIQAACAQVVVAAMERRVDLVLFLGDLCDPDSVCAHAAASVAVDMATTLAEEGIASRWLVGNHDVVEDGSGASVLSALGPLNIVGSASIELRDHPGIETLVARGPGTGPNVDGVRLVSFPYTARSHAYDPVKFLESYNGEIDRTPTVVISHLMLEGIGPGSETADMARGRDVFLPVELVRHYFPNSIIFNGHYHAPQEFKGVNVVGSLVRCRFDEAHNETGFVVIDV